MKKLAPVLILVALALTFSIASAQPPSPVVGWIHLECENGLVDDIWVGVPMANAGHLADGRIVHLRSLYVYQDSTWINIFFVPGKGVDRVWCSMTATFRPEPLKGEVDIDPPH